jgi:hypothetical protein
MSKFKVGDRVRVILLPYVKGSVVKINNDLLEIEISGQEYGNVVYHSSKIELDKEETVEYEHYKYSYKGIKLDPYRILDIYKITCPAQQHAIKKLLRAGNSVKELKQDITEVIDTLKRKLEMLEEDSDNP